MAAHAGTNAPRSWALITRLEAFAGRLELARRATVLFHGRVRHRRADGRGPVFAPHPCGTVAEIAFQAAFVAEAD